MGFDQAKSHEEQPNNSKEEGKDPVKQFSKHMIMYSKVLIVKT